MLDRIRPELDRIGDVHGVAGVNGDRKIFGVRFVHDRAQDLEVHAIEGVTGHAGFEDAFDRIHALRGKLVHLSLRASSVRLRRADESGEESFAQTFRHELRVLGPVAAFRGEERTAEE